MEKFLKSIEKDIKRCEEVLKENNYLEIVIAVEEIADKYKNIIKDIKMDEDRVWNYSKKDLEAIKDKLYQYRNEHIFEIMFNKIKNELKENEEISLQKINEVEKILKEIEVIYNSKLNLYEKWENLRKYIMWASKEDMKIATYILGIINIILKNSII